MIALPVKFPLKIAKSSSWTTPMIMMSLMEMNCCGDEEK
jgi:hypothetical protein